MSRRIAAALALAVAGGMLITPQVLPASASPHAAPALSAPRAGSALIQGVVVNQFGTYVDDVQVQATKGDGTAAASAITYASDREDGPQHGYFFLEVSRGTYTLTLTRPGYKTLELEDVEVTKARQKVSLGEIELEKKLLASRTGASLAKSTVTTKQTGEVHVVVTSKDGSKPTGKVEVREGRKVVGKGTLKAKSKGAITIEVDKLAKGSHSLKVYYLGSAALKASSSGALTLKVIKPKH